MDVPRPGDLRDVTHQTRGARVGAACANPFMSEVSKISLNFFSFLMKSF